MRAGAGFALLMLPAVWAGAAVAQQLPGSADPGRFEQRFQPPPAPKSETAPPVEVEREEEQAPAGAESTPLEIRAVEVEGATVYSAEALAEVWRPFLDHPGTLADLYRIADAVTVKYRNDGYILSRAIVPPQRIAGGVVHIRVVEGYVS